MESFHGVNFNLCNHRVNGLQSLSVLQSAANDIFDLFFFGLILIRDSQLYVDKVLRKSWQSTKLVITINNLHIINTTSNWVFNIIAIYFMINIELHYRLFHGCLIVQMVIQYFFGLILDVQQGVRFNDWTLIEVLILLCLYISAKVSFQIFCYDGKKTFKSY